MLKEYKESSKNNSPLSFLSSRLSQFTKATKLFSTKDHPTKTNVAKEFHDACDGKTNTLVIIKSGQYIAGGYTEVAWSSTSKDTAISNTSQAFLFSVNKQKTYRNTSTRFAISFSDNSWGPRFGANGNADIAVHGEYRLNDNNYCELNRSYSSEGAGNPKRELFGRKYFTIDEYEVYKLE